MVVWRQDTRARSYEGISNQTYEEMMDEETMDEERMDGP